MHLPDAIDSEQRLSRELENFLDIAMSILPRPGDVPRLDGIDVWGGTLPFSGSVGGDHIIYVDFKQRFDLEARIARARELGKAAVAERLDQCRRRAGIALIDVAGHRMTDALLAAMLHQAFLVGALYELDMFGQITRNLFENLNTRFHQSSGAHKFMSLVYGEISEDARFRFLSAAQPVPLVFSRQHDGFVDIRPDLHVSFPPLGMLPSLDVIDRNAASPGALGFKERYEINEWWLMGAGDILLLHTDGLVDHGREETPYYPARLEQRVRDVKDLGARAIFEAISQDVLAFAGLSDDVSLVVVKLAA